MIESEGELSHDEFDDANIPVNISIDQDEESKKWELTADNYMPRRNTVAQGMVHLVADSLEELQEVIKTKILPLYRIAIGQLEKIANFNPKKFKKDSIGLGNIPSLYYWSE